MDPHASQDVCAWRRRMLFMLGAAGITAGWPWRAARAAPETGACVLTPRQTEGPYFVDEHLLRSDIRSDPASGEVCAGLPLTLTLTLDAVGPRQGPQQCRPLAGAIVDIWHCDARGRYSDVDDGRASTAGKKFLRGYQVSDEQGRVRFTTIYPGAYEGRAVHIHFKVRTEARAAQGRELTSQFYFDDAVTQRVHALPPYAGKSHPPLRNQQDGLFRQGGSSLMLPLTTDGDGYAASYAIGLQTT